MLESIGSYIFRLLFVVDVLLFLLLTVVLLLLLNTQKHRHSRTADHGK